MDFAEIARQTSPDIARQIQDADYMTNRGQIIDGARLDDLTRGAQILGIDVIDYPLTDGLYLFIKRPAGDVIALLIEVDDTTAGLLSFGKIRIA